MKNFWNIFLIATGTITIGLFVAIDYLTKNDIEQVVYDSAIDEAELNRCSKKATQYYRISTSYIGGKRAIKNKLVPIIEKDQISFTTKNGNINIRFVVTCNGEIGLFRAKGTNTDIEPIAFEQTKIQYLISLVSQLEDWNVGSIRGEKYDSYFFINFKVRNGKITDIF